MVVEEDEKGFFSELGSVLSEYKGLSAAMLVFFLLCGLGAGYALYNMNPNGREFEDPLDAELDD